MTGSSLEKLQRDVSQYMQQMKDLHCDRAVAISKVLYQTLMILMERGDRENPSTLDLSKSSSATPTVDQSAIAQDDWVHAIWQGFLYTYFGHHVRRANQVIETDAELKSKVSQSHPAIMLDTYLKAHSHARHLQQDGSYVHAEGYRSEDAFRVQNHFLKQARKKR